MSKLISVGIDPGPATGMFFLTAGGRSRAIQCDAVTAPVMLEMFLARYGDVAGVPCGVEEFRTSARPLKGAYADVTRDLVTVLSRAALGHGMKVSVRPAATVKAWGTDRRLECAGLLGLTGHGMVHARDAARHCLFAAVRSGVIPDPVSKKWDRLAPLMPVPVAEDA